MMQSTVKTIFKLGDMIIDQKQIFWPQKYCFALIPIVQLLEGHIILAPKRQVQSFSNLEAVEVFDLTLNLKFLTKGIQSYHACGSSTIYIQNALPQSPLKHMIIHIIPRKIGDLSNIDDIYKLLETYPTDIVSYYNEKMNFYINAYANKILEGIHEQTKKYSVHLQSLYNDDKKVI